MGLAYELGATPMARDLLLNGVGGAPAILTTALMDATAEKVALIGNVWHPDRTRTSLAIRKVHFRCGAVTLNAASEVRVSLQDVSQTAGPPFQPDGTQDQFYDFKTATTALSANAWNSTGNLSADRTVTLASDSASDANSRRLAVVFEYQAFTAADSIVVSTLQHNSDFTGQTGVVLNTGVWAIIAGALPIVAFECDDGTFAFLSLGAPISATNVAAVSSNGAIRRAGLKFRVPSERSIDRLSLAHILPNGSDCRLVLYDSDGTTELRSVDLDNDDTRSASNYAHIDVPIVPQILAANTYYRLALVGSTTTAANVPYCDVNAAALMDAFMLGQDAHWTQHNGTAWADTTTRRPVFGLGVCAYHDGTGGSVHRPTVGLVG